MRPIRPLLLTVTCFLLAITALNAEPVFVANKSVAVDTLSSDTVDSILKGRVKNWQDGKRIILATLKEGRVHEEILSKYAGMNGSQFSNNWSRLVFTGKASAPKTFDTEKELVDYVAATEGAFGYVDSPAVVPGVKVIKIQ